MSEQIERQSENGMTHKHNWLKLLLSGLGVIGFIVIACMLIASESDTIRTTTEIVLFLGFLACHIVAICQVKKGKLTVYRDWADFGWSFAWTIALPIGIFLMIGGMACESAGGKWTCWVISGVLCLMSGGCFAWMFIGAFVNNKGRIGASLLALAARIVGTLFMATFVSKLIDFFNKKEEMTIQQYVVALINLVIFGWIFKCFLAPLVADNRDNI